MGGIVVINLRCQFSPKIRVAFSAKRKKVTD
jgi:hypothetical protein